MIRLFSFFIVSLFLCATSFAQNQASIAIPPQPTVTFSLDFPESVPSHYSIRVTKDGKASYESMGKLTPEAEGDPFSYSFTMTNANLERIFELAKTAKYFQTEVEYKKGRQANTGKKTLSYTGPDHHGEVSYNYSSREEIQQFTRIFQSIASTIEGVRRLQYFHQYQPLALEADLKRMEEMAKAKDLEELQAAAPILQEIMDDKSVLNVSRVRAQRLLAIGNPGTSSR